MTGRGTSWSRTLRYLRPIGLRARSISRERSVSFIPKDLGPCPSRSLRVRATLLFGHPIDLSKLKHSGEEIDVIGRFFEEDKRRILDGPRAAEGGLKRFPLGEFRYIHFAVHGIFDDKNWRRSGLLLWREKGSARTGSFNFAISFSWTSIPTWLSSPPASRGWEISIRAKGSPD